MGMMKLGGALGGMVVVAGALAVGSVLAPRLPTKQTVQIENRSGSRVRVELWPGTEDPRREDDAASWELASGELVETEFMAGDNVSFLPLGPEHECVEWERVRLREGDALLEILPGETVNEALKFEVWAGK